MQLPNWLAAMTGANKFANNPANGFQATLGDMFQGAGHSMAQHYRGQGGTYGARPLIEGVNGGPGISTPIPLVQPEEPGAPGGGLGALFGSIVGSELPPAQNAATPPGMELTSPPPAPPQPMSPSPMAPSAITASLNGGTPWGQGRQPVDPLAGLDLRSLMGTGLRVF